MSEYFFAKPEQDPGTDEVIFAQAKASRYHVDNLFAQPFMLALSHAAYQHLLTSTRRAYPNDIVHRARDPRLVLAELSTGNSRYQFSDEQSDELARVIRNRGTDNLNGIADVHALGNEQLHLARVITNKPYPGVTGDRDPILMLGVNMAGAHDPNLSDMKDGVPGQGKEAYYFYLVPDPRRPGRSITCFNRWGHVYQQKGQHVFDEYGNPVGRRAAYTDLNVLGYTTKHVHDKRFNPEYPIKQLSNPDLEIVRFNAELGMYSVAAPPLPEDLFRHMFPESPELAHFMELVRKFETSRLPQITKIQNSIAIDYENAWYYLRIGKRDEFMSGAAKLKGTIVTEMSKQTLRMINALMKYKRSFKVTLPAPMRTERWLEAEEIPMWQNVLCAVPTRFEDILTLYGAIRAYEIDDHPYHAMAHELMTVNEEKQSIFERPSRYIIDLGRHQVMEEMKHALITSFGDPQRFPHLQRALAAVGEVKDIEGLMRVNNTLLLLQAADTVAKANANMDKIPPAARLAYMSNAQVAAVRQLSAPVATEPVGESVVSDPLEQRGHPDDSSPEQAQVQGHVRPPAAEPQPAVSGAAQRAFLRRAPGADEVPADAEILPPTPDESLETALEVMAGKTAITDYTVLRTPIVREQLQSGVAAGFIDAEALIDRNLSNTVKKAIRDLVEAGHIVLETNELIFNATTELGEYLRSLPPGRVMIQGTHAYATFVSTVFPDSDRPVEQAPKRSATRPESARPEVHTTSPKRSSRRSAQQTEVPLRGPAVAQYILDTYWQLRPIVDFNSFYNYGADRRDVFDGRSFMRMTSDQLTRIPQRARPAVVAAINTGNIILVTTAEEMNENSEFGEWVRELRTQARALILNSVEDRELLRMFDQSESGR